LLPTAYYHIVFTLPHELHPVTMGNRKVIFKLLFDAASQTLLQFAGDQNTSVANVASQPYYIHGDNN
jgi:hypothetical protein